MRKFLLSFVFCVPILFLIPTAFAQDEGLTTAKALRKLIESDSSFVLIDVRTPEEFAEGHITDALNIDYYQAFEDSVKYLSQERTYFLYCRSGSRSAKSRKIMTELGFKQVYDLEGGITNWKEKGYKVVEE